MKSGMSIIENVCKNDSKNLAILFTIDDFVFWFFDSGAPCKNVSNAGPQRGTYIERQQSKRQIKY